MKKTIGYFEMRAAMQPNGSIVYTAQSLPDGPKKEAAIFAQTACNMHTDLVAALKLAHKEIARLSETTVEARKTKAGESNSVCQEIGLLLANVE